jgi:hypothetical protein
MQVDRTSLQAPCPGSLANAVTVVSGADKCVFGVGNPLNTGTCRIALGGLDGDGQPINRIGGVFVGDLVLQPGEGRMRYIPPPGTVTLVFCSFTDSTSDDTAMLEFDTPNC